jgi:hypothetical protein
VKDPVEVAPELQLVEASGPIETVTANEYVPSPA